jgi:DNA ligase 1
MLYRSLVEAYSRIEGVRSRTQVANELAELFARTPARVVGRLVYLIQGKLRPDWEGVEIGLGEKLAVRALAAAARASEPAVSRQLRRLGDVGDAAQEVMRDHSAVPPPLSLEEVYGALERIALSLGKGSQSLKVKLLSDPLERASPQEARYLLRTVTGRLRLGVGDATVLEGLVQAFGARRENVERAYNLTS